MAKQKRRHWGRRLTTDSSDDQRKRVQLGKDGEDTATNQLKALGVSQVQFIETGWRVKGGRAIAPIRKVAADLRGLIAPEGKSVMAEAKWRTDQHADGVFVLRWGDLEDHQHARLTEHLAFGGISLVVWICPAGAITLRYPVPGLQKGRALRWDEAQEHALRRPWALREAFGLD